MAKKFMFRGMEEEEIKALSLEEFAKMLTSRSRRTLQRGFNAKQKKLIEKMKKSKKPVRTHCREMLIIPDMLGKKVSVYTGKEWEPVEITSDKLGHRLGEFVQTRKTVKHSSPGVGATKASKFMPLK